jgi:hypothetical protein
MRKCKPCPCSINGLCSCNECTNPPIANHCKYRIAREKQNKRRKDRDQAMRDLGLIKVRGALGGTYWE